MCQPQHSCLPMVSGMTSRITKSPGAIAGAWCSMELLARLECLAPKLKVRQEEQQIVDVHGLVGHADARSVVQVGRRIS